MSYTLQSLTPRTGTPSSFFPESVFQQSEQPCEDQRPQQSGALTELPPLALGGTTGQPGTDCQHGFTNAKKSVGGVPGTGMLQLDALPRYVHEHCMSFSMSPAWRLCVWNDTKHVR